MESDIAILWKVLLWGLGLCATGFFVLLGITLKTANGMTKPVEEIRDALVGTLDTPGLITKFHNAEKEIKFIKDNCTVLNK